MGPDAATLARAGKLADEIFALEPEVALVKPKVDRLEAARKELREIYEPFSAIQDFRVDGEKSFALLGPKSDRTLIDYAALWKLGVARVKTIMTTTLKAIETEFGKDALAGLTHKERVGYRSVNVFRKPVAEQKKAAA